MKIIDKERVALRRGFFAGLNSPYATFTGTVRTIDRSQADAVSLSWLEVGDCISAAIKQERLRLDQETKRNSVIGSAK